MIATTELYSMDGRASFYGKARVIHGENGTEYLQSYNTIVASRTADGKIHRHWNKWSLTTGRHLNSWQGISKREWDNMPIEEQ